MSRSDRDNRMNSKQITDNTQSISQLNTLVGKFSVTNRVTNPMLSTVSDWAPTFATEAMVSGVYTYTGLGTADSIRTSQVTPLALVAGHKISVRAKYIVKNADATAIQISAFGSVTAGTTVVVDKIDNPDAYTEYTLHGEFTVTNQTGYLRLFLSTAYVDAATSSGKATEIYYCEAIDVTLDMGAGYETSGDILSDIIERSKGGKFEGTTTLVLPTSAGQVIEGSELDLRLITLQNKLYGKTIACFGDSITGNYDYPSYLATLLSATVINCGVGGTLMTGGGTNYNKFSAVALAHAYATDTWTEQDAANEVLQLSKYTTIKTLDLSAVDYLVLFFGTNDFGLETPMGTAESDNTYFVGAIYDVINTLCTAFPNLKIMFVTPMYRAKVSEAADTDVTTNSIGLYLKEYADAIVVNAGLKHIPVFDMWRNCNINYYNHTIWLADLIHPTDAGEVLIAEKIGGALLSLA